jgi:hypothetical protein
MLSKRKVSLLQVPDDECSIIGTLVIQAARVAAQSKAFVKPYLGLLCPIENYRIHGYLTNTKLKLVLVLEDNPIKETDVMDVTKAFELRFVSELVS